jgi:hypothetical protein
MTARLPVLESLALGYSVDSCVMCCGILVGKHVGRLVHVVLPMLRLMPEAQGANAFLVRLRHLHAFFFQPLNHQTKPQF